MPLEPSNTAIFWALFSLAIVHIMLLGREPGSFWGSPLCPFSLRDYILYWLYSTAKSKFVCIVSNSYFMIWQAKVVSSNFSSLLLSIEITKRWWFYSAWSLQNLEYELFKKRIQILNTWLGMHVNIWRKEITANHF